MTNSYAESGQLAESKMLPYSPRYIAVTALYIAVSTFCKEMGNIRGRNSREVWPSFKAWFGNLGAQEAKQWVLDAVKNYPGHAQAHYLLSKEGVWEIFTSLLNEEFEPKN